MEKVPIDDDDRPLEEIKITSITVFVNPYAEPDEEEEEEKAKQEKNVEDEDNEKVGSWYNNPGTGTTDSGAASGGVGKYLKAKTAPMESPANASGLTAVGTAMKRNVGVSTVDFKDFSGW